MMATLSGLFLLHLWTQLATNIPTAAAQGGRIIGGVEAPEGAYDFLGTPDPLVCAGTLIHPQVLLTAAHCSCGFRSDTTNIFLGTNTANRRAEALDVVSVSGDLLIHPDYNSRSNNADIMLVKLSREANSNVPIAELATSAPTTGVVTAIGYGATREGGAVTDRLRFVKVPVVDGATCSSRAYYGNSVNPVTMICAGEAGKDSCQGQCVVCVCVWEDGWWWHKTNGSSLTSRTFLSLSGDSGGPLLDTENHVVGITSFGIGRF